ncbi:uncharacterized protein CCR75_005086 [Bremia lactucae]|uniref:Expansin-like EG45 domain-containing protein n=1 Tax=Bremia lactucae TaxID=4779 RepID=A0A976IMB2_BRELC|nr:hypothetical protein CCR75_005086 [Bremia lactucae]
MLWSYFVLMPTVAFASANGFFKGEGTAYTLGNVSSGNCNFMYDPGVNGNYAALNNDQWDSTRNCGRCAQVSCDDDRCSDKTTTEVVYLLDRCPECKQGDLDLSPSVFKKLTGSDPSRYNIKWQFVDCPVKGNVQYCTKSGSSSSWLAIQPTNFANGVASFKIENQDVTMVDSCYYYLLANGANVNMDAVNVEMTSISGETITDTLKLEVDKCIEGTMNFNGGETHQSSNDPKPSELPPTIAPAPVTPTYPVVPPITPEVTPPESNPIQVPPVSTTDFVPTPEIVPTPEQVPTTPVPVLTPELVPSLETVPASESVPTTPVAAPPTPEQTDAYNTFDSIGASDTNYKAGLVTLADVPASDVSVLQSNEGDVGHTYPGPNLLPESLNLANKQAEKGPELTVGPLNSEKPINLLTEHLGSNQYDAGNVQVPGDSGLSSQDQTQQLPVIPGSGNYKAGTVLSDVPVQMELPVLLSEDGKSKTSVLLSNDDIDMPNNQQNDKANPLKTEQVSTKSSAKPSGTSPFIVVLVVMAVVGTIALAAIAFVVKKKKLDDKRIDRDEAMIRAFDSYSSPVEINATNIARI